MSGLSKNITYNVFGQGLSLVLGFVAVRFVFRSLGGDALGLIYFSLAFSAALSVVLQLGICQSAVREVASHHADRPEYIESFIRTSSLFYWTGYLTLAVIAYTLAPYLVYHWVKLDSLDAPTAVRILRILSLGALVALPGGLYRALLVGLQRMDLTNVIDVSAKGLQQGGIFLILLAHGSLFHVAYWIAGSMTLQVVVYWIVCTRFFSVRALLLPGFSRAVVKQNVGYASGLMTISLCAWVLTEADKVIVSKLLPLTLLGIYTFARSAINQGMLLTGAINNAIFPHFSALHGAGKTSELLRAYQKIQDLVCFGTIPIFAVAPFAAIPLLSRVFDAPSAHMLWLPVTFLCIGYYMNGTLTTPYVVSLAVGRPDITARQNVLSLFIVPSVSAIAICWFGLSGAGFSWVLYHVFYYSYGLPRICRECLGIAPGIWFRHVLRVLGSAILIYGCAWMALALLGTFSVTALAAAYVVATLVYGVVAFRIMGEELRQKIIGFVNPLRLKMREAVVPD
ncbi:MAG: oligosaccharide flippase family protein [Acidobacteriia bacterium]|nr:oligosaccharide flippase family protein [Terriglobia bacterium]